jgi:hypothetical protein
VTFNGPAATATNGPISLRFRDFLADAEKILEAIGRRLARRLTAYISVGNRERCYKKPLKHGCLMGKQQSSHADCLQTDNDADRSLALVKGFFGN